MIELLVAISMLSMVLTLIYAAFSQISTSAVRMTREMEVRQNLRVILKIVSDDLQGVQYLKNFTSVDRSSGLESELRYTEDTEFSRIHMHSAVPSRFHRRLGEGLDPKLHELGYEVVFDADLETLSLVRREDFYLDSDITEGGVSVPIADEIAAFKIEFLRPNNNPLVTEEDWDEEWNSTREPIGSKLPSAIRLTIGQRGPDGTVFEETIDFNLPQGFTSS